MARAPWKKKLLGDVTRSLKAKRTAQRRAEVKGLKDQTRAERIEGSSSCKADERATRLELQQKHRAAAAKEEKAHAARVEAQAEWRGSGKVARESCSKRPGKGKKARCRAEGRAARARTRPPYEAKKVREAEAVEARRRALEAVRVEPRHVLEACKASVRKKYQDGRGKIAEVIAQNAAERQMYARAERSKPDAPRARARGAKGKERQAESDDQMRNELEATSPQLLPVWEKVKRQIKAGPRRTRAEAFAEWTEENADAVAVMIADAADAATDDQFAQELADFYRQRRAA